ncbi:T9SS type A sorting domain-containing protein [Paracrocinitomix mangrovi]|uniref:T9SS type A sorting domain-containing protein n=1 Tax=Paracrocinitomix mangrovi TaxID=2862509 RepID=UPI001C8EF356|nr:T9SS type A sorting domain-containing protein [Paracrocinitomix mangrovi]UKN00811.1 T9SS type A sorting domain-containing protein [Paracrocinitomix mangrovi]
MTRTLLITSLLTASQCFSQTAVNLEFNNVSALIQDDGFNFQNQGSNFAAYEFPKGSNKYVFYAMSYWMGGKDPNGQLHLAAHMYGQGQDFFPGPVADDYNSTYYQNNFSSSIWEISKSTVDYHISHFQDVGYTADQTLLNWPGNGNTAEGVAAQLAPYVDVNQNQVYDPLNGDYPAILGDYAVYTIMNDKADLHTESGGDIIGVEVHSMFYQYATTDDLNNTTFLHLKIFNRSSATYSDFKYGIWVDPDIGNYSNDYVGCDSTRNLGFAYNGESVDNGGSGQDAYGAQVPAAGAVFLSTPMDAFVYYNNGGGITGDPNNVSNFYNYMDGLWLNGAPFTYGGNGTSGTVETTYLFSGDPYTGTGWSEVSEANPPGDRRFLMSTDIGVLQPFSNTCVDLAFVVNNDSTDNLANVNNLYTTTDFVQDYYDNNITPCSQLFASTPEITEEIKVIVYPNPATENVFIDAGAPFDYLIYDTKGSLVQLGNSTASSNFIQLDLEYGIYLLHVKTEKGNCIKKLIIE